MCTKYFTRINQNRSESNRKTERPWTALFGVIFCVSDFLLAIIFSDSSGYFQLTEERAMANSISSISLPRCFVFNNGCHKSRPWPSSSSLNLNNSSNHHPLLSLSSSPASVVETDGDDDDLTFRYPFASFHRFHC